MIMTDLAYILSVYPDNHPQKYQDASLFSFALGCGQRASTCKNILLSDIHQVRYYEGN